MSVILLGGGFKTPGDFPTGLTYWINSTSITGKNDGDAVGNWAPLVGTPTMNAFAGSHTYKTNIKNGLPIVRYDGVDDYAQTSAAISNLIGSTSGTFFAVMSWTDGLVTAEQVISFYTGAAFPFWFGATTAAQASTYYNGGYYASKAAANATWYIVSAWYDATNSYLSLTDTRTASAGSTTGFAAIGSLSLSLVLCAGAGYVGADFGEIAVWNVTLSESERQDIERGLANKWGFTLPY